MTKKILLITIVSFLILMLIPSCQPSGDAKENKQEIAEGKLWPKIEPYETGYLQVSKIHNIFYQLGGNPNGKSVMFQLGIV